MSGLEVFDANGSSKFNTGTRLTRFLETFIVNQNAGSRFVPGLNTGEPQAYVTPRDSQQAAFLPPQRPKFTFNKETQVVSWPAWTGPGSFQWAVTIYVY